MSQAYNPNIESRSDYYDRIETSAEEIARAVEDDPAVAEVGELVHEESDSSRVAMYHHEAISAIEHSDSEPYEWKHLVDDSASWQEVIRVMGYTVYRQDLNKELRDEYDLI
ncbi:hypothetical protein [Halosegnis longus]|uniref:hypothetical protein n=1 Tax=Halosegnis longus TaxID=2216012 RepID=UPI00129D7E44|nr:hypothetical protein [Halosegnis longus]